MPTSNELLSIVSSPDTVSSSHNGDSAIDESYFPNTAPNTFWLSDAAYDGSFKFLKAYSLNFYNVQHASGHRLERFYLRLVRGGKAVYNRSYTSAVAPNGSGQKVATHVPNQWPDDRYDIDTSNNTVTDDITTLMWKQCPEGLYGNDCSGGTIAAYSWSQALERAEEVNGNPNPDYTDWRVPNMKELLSLAALDRGDPAINLTAFPGTPANGFWLASPMFGISAFYEGKNFAVYFDEGYLDYGEERTRALHLRLVRDTD